MPHARTFQLDIQTQRLSSRRLRIGRHSGVVTKKGVLGLELRAQAAQRMDC